MVRPQKERRVEQLPPISDYKPAGIPMRSIEEILITIEEMEAIRLSDVEQLDQATAAERMEVSAPTFNRILNSAHRKIAAALWKGYALRIDGGNFRVAHRCKQEPRYFICHECGHSWSLPHGTGKSAQELDCPICQSNNVSRDHDKF